jgi:hypothetical protein
VLNLDSAVPATWHNWHFSARSALADSGFPHKLADGLMRESQELIRSFAPPWWAAGDSDGMPFMAATDARWQAVAMQRELRLFHTVELPPPRS